MRPIMVTTCWTNRGRAIDVVPVRWGNDFKWISSGKRQRHQGRLWLQAAVQAHIHSRPPSSTYRTLAPQHAAPNPIQSLTWLSSPLTKSSLDEVGIV